MAMTNFDRILKAKSAATLSNLALLNLLVCTVEWMAWARHTKAKCKPGWRAVHLLCLAEAKKRLKLMEAVGGTDCAEREG